MTVRVRLGRGAASAAIAAAATVTLVGCGTHASGSEVEEQIRSELSAATAKCPGDLEGRVGAVITCAATRAGEAFDVTVTVTELVNGKINFSLERVGAAAVPAPSPVPSPVLAPAPPAPGPAVPSLAGPVVAKEVSAQLTKAVGRKPDTVTCPDLPAVVKAMVRCALMADSTELGVTVTVTQVHADGRVLFDLKVDDTPS
jgi:hypothetical protein